MTIFVGCGFAAKYREGGGVLSVLPTMDARTATLKLDAIWLELVPATGDSRVDQAKISN